MVRTIELLFLVMVSCTGQNDMMDRQGDQPVPGAQDTSGQAVVAFDTLYHDFGTIIEGEIVVCYFDYRNGGTSELVINDVEATCGCTTPDWNREPLGPGESERLKVVFDSRGRSGSQRKAVSVLSNAENPVVRITLSAEVMGRN